MRRTIFFVGLFCCTVHSAIHVNQIGYYPNAPKVVTITDTSVKRIQILDMDSKNVIDVPQNLYEGFYNGSKENVVSIEFSHLTHPGTYKIIAGTDTSASFMITDSIYNSALKTLVKSYYYQRSSFELDPTYAGKWSRGAGHPDLALTPLEANTSTTEKDVQGGWYDAGDFGKYVVCAGITCGNMLGSYELCPELLGDGSLNIPESKNSKNDLLDEIKYELDWLIRMQDSDGGVFFKVGPTEWPWDIMPEEDWTERFIIGKSTTSTLNFTAVMAMAGRIYLKYDSNFAKDCRDRAEKAWEWAKQNPGVVNPENIDGTGPYADGNDKTYSDEFFWALSELYITTGKDDYKDTLFSMVKSKTITSYAWWQDVKNLGFFSLSVHSDMLPDSIKSLVKNTILNSADKMVSVIDNCAYKIPMKMDNYYWGSNATIGNMANILIYAYNVDQKPEYLSRLIYTTDYIFGRNPTGYSYITGLGSRSPKRPGHRQCTADGVTEPIPGFVVGGPNLSTDGADQYLVDLIEAGTPPAKCYVDHSASWASNEVSINQNSAWVPVLSYLEKHIPDFKLSHVGKKCKKDKKIFDFRLIPLPNGILIKGALHGNVLEISIFDINGKCLMKKIVDNNVIPLKNISTPVIVKIKCGPYSVSKLIYQNQR